MSSGAGTPRPAEDLGKRLREGREAKGWSVEDVSQRTRISLRHLKALEAGDLTGIPAHVYARGFVRTYAKLLEIDEDPLMRMLDESGIHSATREPARGTAAQVALASVAEKTGVATGKRAVVPARIWVAAGAVVLGGLLIGLVIRGLFAILDGDEKREIPPSPFAAETKKQGAAIPATGKGAEGRTMATTSANGSAAAHLRPVRISVTASDVCWMSVQVDESMPEERTLSAGESAYWSGVRRLRVLIGNSGGVAMSSADGPVRLPARSGRIVNLLFTPSGVERLEVPSVSASGASDSAAGEDQFGAATDVNGTR